MAFEKILNHLLQQKGVEGVIFLDSEGEAVFCYGKTEHERLKAMGAYQGIVLSSVKRLDTGENGTIWTRCLDRSILTQQLKDGYYVSVVLSGDANLAQAHFTFQDYFIQLEKEL
jgi:predicted regulator of Ras-like GTPase activity (Roadblock/LC7/MglB family)